MSKYFLDKTKLRLKNVKIDQKVFIFGFFLFLSTVFWFLNALNKKYTTTITYPVNYVNFPKDKILVGELPENLEIEISADGFSILQYKLSPSLLPVVADVGLLSLKREIGGDTSKYYILTREFAYKLIANKLNKETQINEIAPDSLIFEFDVNISKKIPVKTNYTINFARQYIQKGEAMIIPDSVEIRGPNNMVDSINEVETKHYNFENVSKSIEVKMQLDKVKNLQYSYDQIMLNIPVEKFTENKIKIPIAVKNVPEDLELKLFPPYVNISYIVLLSQYDKVDKEMFKAMVDYNDVEKNPNNLKVRIILSPENIISYGYYPRFIEYIIERKSIKRK